MNYRGSYRKLLGNSRSAMLAAIEIYNKPRIDYRDQVVAELLINGWELLLKSIVSRNGLSIYYKKKHSQPYRTLSLTDAFRKASTCALWPVEINKDAVGGNLEFLSIFRDNAVHFYNQAGFGAVVYLLAQTSVTNYHDLCMSVFGEDLTEQITWQLLPLGMRAPIDPVRYLAGDRPEHSRRSVAVDEFMRSLVEATRELEERGIDSSRLMTIYDVALGSVKKLESADIVVGVSGEVKERVLVTRKLDPNRSHPFRFTRLVSAMEAKGLAVSRYEFQAITWKHSLKTEPKYCWVDEDSGLTKWSPEVMSFVSSLGQEGIDVAVSEYRQNMRDRQAARKATARKSRAVA